MLTIAITTGFLVFTAVLAGVVAHEVAHVAVALAVGAEVTNVDMTTYTVDFEFAHNGSVGRVIAIKLAPYYVAVSGLAALLWLRWGHVGAIEVFLALAFLMMIVGGFRSPADFEVGA